MSLQLYISFMLHKAKENKEGCAPLVIRITYQKQRKQLSPGFHLTHKEWDKVQQNKRSSDEHLKSVVTFIETFRVKIHQLANTLELQSRLDLETLVELCLNKQTSSLTLLQLFQQHQEELTRRTAIDRSKATLDKYRYTEDKLKAFLQFQYQRRDMPLTKLEPSFIKLFYDYMLLECRIHHNTIVKYCMNLKRILNYGKEKGLLKHNPFAAFHIGYQNIDRSYLTASELAILERKQMPVKCLQIIKDFFLFQCYTGLAFVAMSRLRKDHLVEGIDGKQWVVIHRQKTGGKSMVPLLKPALDIIRQYARSPDVAEGHLLPDISNQKLNAYLKEVSTLCGLQKPLTSHMGRRTFATTVALSNGVSIESIAKVLGHASTKMTSLYAVVTEQKLSEEMAGLQAKLKSRTGDQT